MTAQTPWRIQMFATLKAQHHDRVFERFRTHKAGLLLARLAFPPHRKVTREELLELLWPEEPIPTAQNNLRQTLYTLRRLLQADVREDEHLLHADHTILWVHPDLLSTDVAEFEAGLHRAAGSEDAGEKIAALTEAIALYSGELLSGFYDDWIVMERYRLEQLYGLGLGALVPLLEAQDRPEQAVEYALRLEALNPLEEAGHLAVMRLYGELGQPELARKQYRKMERILWEELQARPSRAASDLMAWIEKEKRMPGRERSESEPPLLTPAQPLPSPTIEGSKEVQKTETGERRAPGETQEKRAGRSGRVKPEQIAVLVVLAVLLGFGIWRMALSFRPQGVSTGQETPLPDDFETLNRQVVLLRDGKHAETPAEHSARRRRQALLCTALAEMAWTAWYGDEEEIWLRRLDTLKPDTEAALRWSLEHEPQKAVQMAGALTRFWYLRGHGIEGRRWQQQALERSRERTVTRARALVGMSLLETGWWQKPRLRAWCMEALDIYREQNDRWGQAHALRHLGLIAADQAEGHPGDYRLAMQHYTEALRRFRELEDKRGQAVTLLSMAYCHRAGMSEQEALRQKNECGLASLRLFREVGNAWGGELLMFGFFAAETKSQPCDDTTRPFFQALRDECRIWMERTTDLSLRERYATETLQLDLKLHDISDAIGMLAWFSSYAYSGGDYRRSARLLGAYIHLKEKFSLPLAVTESHRINLRAKLGESTYQSCLAAGRTMTLEQALAEAQAGQR